MCICFDVTLWQITWKCRKRMNKKFQMSVGWVLYIYKHIYIYIKVKCSRYRPDVAQRVGRGIALLFRDCGTRRGWVVSSTPRPHFTHGKDPVLTLQEVGWAPGPVWTGRKSLPHQDSIPDRPTRGQSLYRLSYPAHIHIYIHMYVCVCVCVCVCSVNYCFMNSYGLPLFRNLYNFALRTALDSSVSLVTRYRVGRPWNGYSFARWGGEYFSLCHFVQTGSGAYWITYSWLRRDFCQE